MRFALRCALVIPGLLLTGAAKCFAARAESSCLPIPVAEFARSTAAKLKPSMMVQPRIKVDAPGRYCLDEDVVQRQLFDFKGKAFSHDGHQLVTISSDGVTLDLSGHLIGNEWQPKGITMIRFLRYNGGYQFGDEGFRKLTIRAGRFKSPGESGVGFDLRSEDYKRNSEVSPVRIPGGESPQSFFRDTSHVIEDVTLDTGNIAIMIDGANNVIRNNRIVVNGSRALIATGPNLILENNIIEIRGRPSEIESIKGYGIPVQLIQGDGAIIRNNTIRFIGSTSDHRPEVAFDLTESRKVLFDNNQLESIPALERRDTLSSGR